MRAIRTCSAAVVLVMTLLAGTAQANSGPQPAGRWLMRFYIDPTLELGATSEICFRADGSWRALDFPISGNWFQLGDRLRFVGIYADGIFSAFGAFSSGNAVSGEFNDTERPSRLPFSNGNVQLTRLGRSCTAPAASQRSAASGRAYSR